MADYQIMPDENSICAMVRRMQEEWIVGNTKVSKYVDVDFYEDIQTIEAYLNSKHTTGEEDSLNRPKPFFNIVLAVRNIWARATDLDRKNFRVKATKTKDILASYLLNIHLQRWMKDADFGRFLNKWGMYLASYNSVIVKMVENSKGLTANVIDWNAVMCDIIDFDNNPVYEILYYTPAQLRKNKNYDKDMVEAIISAHQTRTTTDNQQKDTKDNYIKVYEVHGELPLSYLTDNEADEDEYVQQMHVVSYAGSKDGDTYEDYTLYKGREKKSPYMLTWLLPSVDGSVSLEGSVKSLFQEQWMVNHNKKTIKDYLDLVSKVVFQTSDGNYANKNILKNIEQGQIMVYDEQKSPLSPINNGQHSIEALMNFGREWMDNASQKASTPDILQGENLPSGTAYRQAAIVQSEAHSNFHLMLQNKGLHLENLGREFIIPYLLKKMDTTEEMSATLSDYGVDKIDQMYIANEAVKRFNQKAVDAVINRRPLPNLQQEQQQVMNNLAQLGEQRFIKPSDIPSKTWKDIIGKFEGDVEYAITDENKDTEATLATLSTVFQTLATPGGQMAIQSPTGKMVFSKILEETGKLSPVEIKETMNQAPQPPQGATPALSVGQVGGASEVNQIQNNASQF